MNQGLYAPDEAPWDSPWQCNEPHCRTETPCENEACNDSCYLCDKCCEDQRTHP